MNIKFSKRLVALALVGSFTLCSCAPSDITYNDEPKVNEEMVTEQEVVDYLNNLYSYTKTLVEGKAAEGKEASINTFSFLIRFIEGTEQINGYTFDSLTEKSKETIINLLASLKTLITETYGDFYSYLTLEQQTSLDNVVDKLKNMKDATSKALEGPIEVVIAGGTAIVKNINETETVEKVKTKTKEKWNEIADWANKQK